MNVRRVTLIFILTKQVNHRLLDMLIHFREGSLRVNAPPLVSLVVVICKKVLPLFLLEMPVILFILNSVQSYPQL